VNVPVFTCSDRKDEVGTASEMPHQAPVRMKPARRAHGIKSLVDVRGHRGGFGKGACCLQGANALATAGQ